MTGDCDPAGGETEKTEPEDSLWEKQKIWIVIAIALLLILIALVVFVNVPALRAAAGVTMTKTDWQLESYLDATGIMVPALTGHAVTAQFLQDGTVRGSAGCNSYSASYTTSDYAITISGPVRTLMACTDPGVIAQVEAYLSRLESAKEFRVTSTSLKLYGADGKTLLVFIPEK